MPLLLLLLLLLPLLGLMTLPMPPAVVLVLMPSLVVAALAEDGEARSDARGHHPAADGGLVGGGDDEVNSRGGVDADEDVGG